jgi:hypothetical protein
MNVWCYLAMIFPSHPRKKKTNKVISKINWDGFLFFCSSLPFLYGSYRLYFCPPSVYSFMVQSGGTLVLFWIIWIVHLSEVLVCCSNTTGCSKIMLVGTPVATNLAFGWLNLNGLGVATMFIQKIEMLDDNYQYKYRTWLHSSDASLKTFNTHEFLVTKLWTYATWRFHWTTFHCQ